MDKTFKEYIEEKMGDRLIMTISVEEIMDDFNMGLKDTFYNIALLTNFAVTTHPDYDWTIVIFNKVQVKAIKDKEKK